MFCTSKFKRVFTYRSIKAYTAAHCKLWWILIYIMWTEQEYYDPNYQQKSGATEGCPTRAG